MNDKDIILELLIDNPHLIDEDNFEMFKLEYPEILDALEVIFNALNPIIMKFKKIIDSIFNFDFK